MSGGEQIRDYLPVIQSAYYIVKIATQNKINGIINCCSGKPIRIKKLIKNYLVKKKAKIILNYGVYPYNNYEPMFFWGNKKKLEKIIGSSL